MPPLFAATNPTNPTNNVAQDRNAPPQPRQVKSRELLGGKQLLVIEHAGSLYYLRMTRNNKLILTK